MRVSNFMADIFFGVSTIEMLEFHASSKHKTFQYVFSKPSERTLMGPPPSWAKGVGHGEELQYMFDAGTKRTNNDLQNIHIPLFHRPPYYYIFYIRELTRI
jgi:carboxylesterase type B